MMRAVTRLYLKRNIALTCESLNEVQYCTSPVWGAGGVYSWYCKKYSTRGGRECNIASFSLHGVKWRAQVTASQIPFFLTALFFAIICECVIFSIFGFDVVFFCCFLSFFVVFFLSFHLLLWKQNSPQLSNAIHAL